MSPRTPECCSSRWSLSVALFFALLAGACGASSEITTGPTPVKCEVSLSTTTTTLAATGGSGTIAVATRIPGARFGTVEVRPVMEVPGLPG